MEAPVITRCGHPDPRYAETQYIPRFCTVTNGPSLSIPGEREDIIQFQNRISDRPTYVNVDRQAPLAYRHEPSHSNLLPEQLFVPSYNRSWIVEVRYAHKEDSGILLLQTDGACPDNGGSNPRAGAAFVYAPGDNGIVSFKLFNGNATSNRAELIAVIAALRIRIWWAEGYHTVVIATDSEYVVKGCTKWCRKWERNGWMTSGEAPVLNQDLWKELIWSIECLHHHGCRVEFWKVPRAWNVKADAAAKRAVKLSE